MKHSQREISRVIGWRTMSFDRLRIAFLIVHRRIIYWICIFVFHKSSRTKFATFTYVSACKIEVSLLDSLTKFSLIKLPRQIIRPNLGHRLLPFFFIVFARIVVHRLVSAIVLVRVELNVNARYSQDE